MAHQSPSCDSEDFSDVQGSGLENEADNRELPHQMEHLTQMISKLVEQLDVSSSPSVLVKFQPLPLPPTNTSAPPYEHKQPVIAIGPRNSGTQAIRRKEPGDLAAYKTPQGLCPLGVHQHPPNEPQPPNDYPQWVQ